MRNYLQAGNCYTAPNARTLPDDALKKDDEPEEAAELAELSRATKRRHHRAIGFGLWRFQDAFSGAIQRG